MDTILENEAVANLPVAELENELEAFLEPVTMQLPEERLRRVGKLAVQGIIAGQSPMVTQMARGSPRGRDHLAGSQAAVPVHMEPAVQPS